MKTENLTFKEAYNAVLNNDKTAQTRDSNGQYPDSHITMRLDKNKILNISELYHFCDEGELSTDSQDLNLDEVKHLKNWTIYNKLKTRKRRCTKMKNKDMILIGDYDLIKFVLRNQKESQKILIAKLKDEIDSLEDMIADGYREDKTELELTRFRLKEIESLVIPNEEQELTEEQFQKFVEKYKKGDMIKKKEANE